VPETVTIDKSGANLAALEAINDDRETPIKIRQSKYLNNPTTARARRSTAKLGSTASIRCSCFRTPKKYSFAHFAMPPSVPHRNRQI
jgi:transposase-like protein